MTEKLSGKTEDDMLEQTFNGMDTQMTYSDTEEPAAKDEESLPTKQKQKSSNNKMVWLGMGAATLLGGIYVFIIQPMLNPAPMPAPQVQSVKPLAPVDNKALLPEEPKPAVQQQVQQPVAQPVTAAPMPAPAPAKEASQAQVLPPIVPAPQVAAQPVVQQVNQAASSVNLTEKKIPTTELDEILEQQKKSFTDMLASVSGNVSGIESRLEKQDSLNKSFEERIAALEAKQTKQPIKQVSKAAALSGKEESGTNKVSNKQSLKTKDTEILNKSGASKARDLIIEGGDILVDKSSKPVVSVKSKTQVVEKVEKEEVLPVYNIHSIFSGRVWFKNADGSLSTYQEGEKLPTGEIIQNISMENFVVTTNKRKISK